MCNWFLLTFAWKSIEQSGSVMTDLWVKFVFRCKECFVYKDSCAHRKAVICKWQCFEGVFVFTGRYCGKGWTGSVFLFLYRKTTQCGFAAERKNHEEKNGFRMKPEEVQPVRRMQSKGTHRMVIVMERVGREPVTRSEGRVNGDPQDRRSEERYHSL